jgi:hypothetical protein
LSAAGSSVIRARRRKASRSALLLQRGVPVAAIFGVTGLVLGLVFAGSPERIAPGVRVDGVDIGGLTAGEARHRLQARAARLAHVPVVFTAGGRSWRVEPAELGVQVDWAAAVAAAQRQGRGFGPFRGLRRLEVRVFGADVVPQTRRWRWSSADLPVP